MGSAASLGSGPEPDQLEHAIDRGECGEPREQTSEAGEDGDCADDPRADRGTRPELLEEDDDLGTGDDRRSAEHERDLDGRAQRRTPRMLLLRRAAPLAARDGLGHDDLLLVGYGERVDEASTPDGTFLLAIYGAVVATVSAAVATWAAVTTHRREKREAFRRLWDVEQRGDLAEVRRFVAVNRTRELARNVGYRLPGQDAPFPLQAAEVAPDDRVEFETHADAGLADIAIVWHRAGGRGPYEWRRPRSLVSRLRAGWSAFVGR